MMRIILLLLVTLTGPFCTFTQASTLVAPTTKGLTLEANTVPDAPAVNDTTMETGRQDAVSTLLPALGTTEVSALTEVKMASTAAPVTESEAILETTAPTDTNQETEAALGETTEAGATNVTAESKETVNAEMEMEDEAMGTGQVVGIVIGALIVVIVVIAIIILVVRRMGQYSTAKKRKPQKQESILISPLKRKARQEEKKKKTRKF